MVGSRVCRPYPPGSCPTETPLSLGSPVSRGSDVTITIRRGMAGERVRASGGAGRPGLGARLPPTSHRGHPSWARKPGSQSSWWGAASGVNPTPWARGDRGKRGKGGEGASGGSTPSLPKPQTSGTVVNILTGKGSTHSGRRAGGLPLPPHTRGAPSTSPQLPKRLAVGRPSQTHSGGASGRGPGS